MVNEPEVRKVQSEIRDRITEFRAAFKSMLKYEVGSNEREHHRHVRDDAFKALTVLVERVLLRFCAWKLELSGLNKDEAADYTQTALFRFFKNEKLAVKTGWYGHSYDLNRPFLSFVCTIAANLILTDRDRNPTAEERLVFEASQSVSTDWQETIDWGTFLQILSDEERKIVELRDEGYSVKEVAEKVSSTSRDIDNKTRAVRRRLRKEHEFLVKTTSNE